MMWMPHMPSNTPSKISYGLIFSELLRIARCTLGSNDFISRAFDLFSKMVELGRNRATLKNIYKQH